jgi:hypothetical protein
VQHRLDRLGATKGLTEPDQAILRLDFDPDEVGPLGDAGGPKRGDAGRGCSLVRKCGAARLPSSEQLLTEESRNTSFITGLTPLMVILLSSCFPGSIRCLPTQTGSAWCRCQQTIAVAIGRYQHIAEVF